MTLAIRARKQLGSFRLDVAFEAPGDVTALFGASGAGKSLTLRTIAGLDRPDSGRVALGGRVLLDVEAGIEVPTRDRGLGYVFQQYALFPHLDVLGNVEYGLGRLDRAARRERATEVLRTVGLADRARAYPRDLSGGQQQRVALARALAPSPSLLLLDEPLAAVDAIARAQLRRELRAVHERTGVPMVLVTHDLAEVRALADHLVVLDEGRVVQTGATREVLATPADGAAARLFAAVTEPG